MLVILQVEVPLCQELVGMGDDAYAWILHQHERMNMNDPIQIENRGDFALWAIEAAKQIVGDQGFELAKAARDGGDEELRLAGNALGQAITNALMEVYDGLLEDPAG
jgi:hypothetical protein